jgi:GNAT superfamily N-acetyltransferase
VVDVGEVVVAFAALSWLRQGRMQLEQLFVDPGAMRVGYGRALFVHVCERARQEGAEVLEIQSDPYAEGFYRSMGAELRGYVPSASIAGRELPLLEVDLCAPLHPCAPLH